MDIFFHSTKNTRTILGDNFRFIRSDVPIELSENEIKWLKDNNVLTVVDLREDTERLRKMCPLENDKAFTYLIMPVSGGDIVPCCVADVPVTYIKMADEQMVRIVETIVNAKTNVLYFCNAGKYRTGIVSAILLHRCGYTEEYIIADYMQSADNLKEILESYAQENPNVDIDVITPRKEYIKTFLLWLNNQKIWKDNIGVNTD